MYVAVKGGQKAIENAHRLLADKRRGRKDVPEIGTDQIREQLSLAVDRVMTEGSLYDPELAALAIKQAQGDLVEAIFLLRAFRTTLPRLAVTLPVDTSKMALGRRISAAFKDLPGGQILGPTFDYTHRLLEFDLQKEGGAEEIEPVEIEPEMPEDDDGNAPHVADLLNREQLIQREIPGEDDTPPFDLTREPIAFPVGRDARLQNLARGDEGFLFALAYSNQRGHTAYHPFVAELRVGGTAVTIIPEELGFELEIGEIQVTECEIVSLFNGSHSAPPQFTRGYGLVFGHSERKAMAMAQLDRSLRADEFGEERLAPSQDEEFVLSHSDNVESSGFVQHLKLPHHVDFQGELLMVRKLREDWDKRHKNDDSHAGGANDA